MEQKIRRHWLASLTKVKRAVEGMARSFSEKEVCQAVKNIAKSGKALCEQNISHFLAFYVEKSLLRDVIFSILLFYPLLWNTRGLRLKEKAC